MERIGRERESVQDPLIQYVCEIGWEYISPEEAKRLKGGTNGLILKDIFKNQISKLNDFMDSVLLEEVIRKLESLYPNIEGNMEAWEYLKGLKTVFVPWERRERNIKLIDEDHKNNLYHVSDEFYFTNGRYSNKFDVVFFINGIPVFFVEAKAPGKKKAIEEALEQVIRYHRETPEAMTLLQVYSLVNVIHFLYSTTWNTSSKNLFNWRTESQQKVFEDLVKSFFNKRKVVKFLLDYILFTKKDETLQKVILRPHQIRAVEKIEERAKDKRKRRGLIWHTQGSGKTYTMIVSARRLMENPIFENPTIIMLVDRNELESQLFTNLKSVGFEHIYIAQSKEDLQSLLENDTRGIIVSTIQKFQGMPPNINTRENIFVLVDEAHRTTGGLLGNYLMGALPKATFLGFTGTPVDRTSRGKSTFEIFGRDDPTGYLDKYSIAESIEDGTTLPLHYTLARNDLLVDRETLEKEFLDLKEAEGISDIEELNRILDRAVNLRNMLKSPDRIRKVAEFVVEHFKEYVEPLGYKAFLVAVDREACALYKEELDKLLPPEYSKVVYSKNQNDDELLKKYHLTEEEEERVRKAFRNPKQMPKILIVTEKLLTGFDAPILYCMYLDKPMRDHVLLQAIARVNRPYEDEDGNKKPCGLIVDFVGIFQNLEKALAFDSKDMEGVVRDLSVLKERFKELMEKAKEYFSIFEGKSKDKEVEAIYDYFMEEEKRQEFIKLFKEIQTLFEILSPDEFLRPYLEDYLRLVDIKIMVEEIEEAGTFSSLELKEFAKKTAELVKKHTKMEGIEATFDMVEINEHTLRELERASLSDIQKVFSLIKAIEKEVINKSKSNPYLIPIGERAKKVVEEFKQRQISTLEAYRTLKEIAQEINSAKIERAKMGFSDDAFAIYWYLKREGIEVEKAKDIAIEMDEVFEEFPHWKESEEQEREVRTSFYKLMLKLIQDVKKLSQIVDLLLSSIKRSAI